MSYLPQMKRERQIRSVDLAFKQSLSGKEFEEMTEAANYRGCPVCPDSFPAAEGIKGDKGKLYCSQGCFEVAERENAPLIKPQPTGTVYEGWQI